MEKVEFYCKYFSLKTETELMLPIISFRLENQVDNTVLVLIEVFMRCKFSDSASRSHFN